MSGTGTALRNTDLHESTSHDHAEASEGNVLLRACLALAAAMGIGRFVYTPILPLMEQQAGLSPAMGAQIATANYVGYLIGAVLLSVWPRLVTSRALVRGSLIALLATLALMPFTAIPLLWMALRCATGITSAVIFIASVQAVLRTLRRNPHLSGWAYGGVGLGIVLSGAFVLLLGREASWSLCWYLAAALCVPLVAPLWTMLDKAAPVTESRAGSHAPRPRRKTAFALLLASYFLEGVGYIIAATFLVAALRDTNLAWLSNGAWGLVGFAVIPSCVVWSICARWISRPTLMVLALSMQAAAVIVLGTSTNTVAVLGSAIVFGGTFMSVVTLVMATGAELGVGNAAPILTASYGVGQIAGPLIVQPTLSHGYTAALIIAGATLLVGALLGVLLRLAAWKPSQQENPARTATLSE